jgi:small subunit ribosomal protein SAe
MAAAAGQAPPELSQYAQDVQMLLAADAHLGTKNCDFQMERYVYKRRSDGTCTLKPSLHGASDFTSSRLRCPERSRLT